MAFSWVRNALGEMDLSRSSVLRVLQGQRASRHVTDRERRDLVDAFPSGGARPREDDLPDELGFLQGDHLRHETAERESEEIDLLAGP
jgi:hypothetical protein